MPGIESGNGSGAPVGRDVFREYFESLCSHLSEHWRPPDYGKPLAAIIGVRVQATGVLQRIEVVRTSGDDRFDQIAMLTLIGSQPLPILPLALGGAVDVQLPFFVNQQAARVFGAG